jgi:hypothetical protein
MPSTDHLLADHRGILISIDEANAISYGILRLMMTAHEEENITIMLRLNQLRERFLELYQPEEWEAYSRLCERHNHTED